MIKKVESWRFRRDDRSCGSNGNWSLTPSFGGGESEGEKANSAAVHVLVIHANLLGKR